MNDTIISVENLSKRYVLGRGRQKGDGLSHALESAIRSPFKWLRSGFANRVAPQEFWALQNVTLDVKRGETVGIIGSNGAGKSTLLKILSRITEPTRGRVRLRGRVASLLEVGTGFHQELTGRENIFLNGAILGMTRAETKRKLDEIIAFSEIETFLDTPVKRYSSGMYMRLAFAVAAHLEQEILIVDEVLAVGDAAFQEKCIGKMQGVARNEGRTVLFVSHQMSAIQRLCDRVYLMKGGRVHSEGPTATVIGEYLSEAKRARTVDLRGWKDRVTNGEAKIVSVSITDATGGSGTVPFGGELVVTINAVVKAPQLDPIFGLLVHDAMGQNLIDTRSCHDGLRLGRVVGPVSVEVHVPNVSLYPGRYLLSPWMTDAAGTRDLDYPRRSCAFDVLPSVNAHGDLTCGSRFGIFFVPSRWKRSTFGSENQVPRHTRVAGDRFVPHI